MAGGKGLDEDFNGAWGVCGCTETASDGGVGTIAGSMGVGSSRKWRKMVAAAGWGSVSEVPVKPSGTGMGLANVGSVEMAWIRKRFEPVSVQDCAVSDEHCRNEISGKRTRVANGSQSLVGASCSELLVV